jgi:ribosomal protein S18 acetylase RimI-like enzyme
LQENRRLKIRINKLPQSKWKDYKSIRLRALRRDPQAFGSSYEEEKKFKAEDWRRRISNAYFAFMREGDKPIGTIVVYFEIRPKTRHIANIFGVYVDREYRDRGIGTMLLTKALGEILKKKGIVKIKLQVNPKQFAAVKLYKKMGFKSTGVMKKELKVNRKFYDELCMEKILS